MALVTQGIQALRTTGAYAVNILATSTFATQTFTSSFIRISAQANCFIRIATSATGVAAVGGTLSEYLAAGVVEFKRVNYGDLINVIAATGAATGVLVVSEVIDA